MNTVFNRGQHKLSMYAMYATEAFQELRAMLAGFMAANGQIHGNIPVIKKPVTP